MAKPVDAIGSNGNGDLKELPPVWKFFWLVLNRLGLATVLVLVAAGVGTYWLKCVSMPESEARLQLLKQTAANGDRMLTLLDKMLDSEQKQGEWQLEWKTYISDQHRQRAAEAKAIVAYQQGAMEFMDRTESVHKEQLRALKELGEAIHEMRESAKSESEQRERQLKVLEMIRQNQEEVLKNEKTKGKTSGIEMLPALVESRRNQ